MPTPASCARPLQSVRACTAAALLVLGAGLIAAPSVAYGELQASDVAPLRLDGNAFSFDEAVYLQAGQDGEFSIDLVPASSRGTYRYLKFGVGATKGDAIDFTGLSNSDLGLVDVTQDVPILDSNGDVVDVIEDAFVLRQYSDEPTSLQSEEGFGPALNIAAGLDVSLGEEFLGNKLRPRLEVEYLFRDALINQTAAEVTFRDAERNTVGNLIFDGNGQTIPGDPQTVQAVYGDSEVLLNTIGVNGTLTYEIYPRFRPYVGAGVGLTYGSVEVGGLESQSDTGIDISILGGLIFSVSEDFELEFGVRMNRVDLELYGEEIEIETITGTVGLIVRL